MRHLTRRLTYANVVATLALFLAIGGGGAFAATNLARNSVGPAKIKAGAVTNGKLANGAVTGTKPAAGAVGAARLGVGAAAPLRSRCPLEKSKASRSAARPEKRS